MPVTPTLESPPGSPEATTGPTHPDVAALVGTSGGRTAVDIALKAAEATAGRVWVIRCVDNTGVTDPQEMTRRSAAARSELARLVADYIDVDGIDITERLHVGTVRSLLRTLDPSVGTVIVADDDATGKSEDLALCPVPIRVVDHSDRA